MKNQKIIKYFVITFLWAWIIWTPFVLPYFGVYENTETLQGLRTLAIMLGAFGPLLAALILSYKSGGKQGIKNFFKKCLSLKIKPIYYLVAIVLGLGITAIAHYLVNVLSIDVLPNSLVPEGIDIPIYILVVPYALMLLILGGGQEEFGWRGYAQEPMQKIFGIVKGSIIIGLLWSLWHGPLWLMPGEGHAYYSFLAFIIYTTSWSLVIGIVYNLSGKKMVIPWIMHTLANLSVPLFPVLFLEDVPQPGYWVWTLLNLVVAVALSLWFVFVKNKKVYANPLEQAI